jgi:S1-C subfamily serine protease
MTERDVVVAEVERLFGDGLGDLAERMSTIDEADTPPFSGLDPASRQKVLADGTAGLRKIIDSRQGELTDAEVVGLEAIIVLEGRPALFIQGGDFFGVPLRWQVLNAHREAIKTSIARTGRIEITGHPELDWIGTGFLAGPDTVLTNRHVAREFARTGAFGWKFKPGMSARLNVNAEHGGTDPVEFTLTGIVGMHERYDLAVLTVARTGTAGESLPTPLPVAAIQPGAVVDRMVYVVGYPGWDGLRNDAVHMREIFADVYGVKRLQPGLITSWTDDARALTHDCSTLGGNSGSPVIDLETHQVVGVHYNGTYLVGNKAVPLWPLTGDDLLRKAQVNFV